MLTLSVGLATTGPLVLLFANLTLLMLDTPSTQHFTLMGVRLTDKASDHRSKPSLKSEGQMTFHHHEARQLQASLPCAVDLSVSTQVFPLAASLQLLFISPHSAVWTACSGVVLGIAYWADWLGVRRHLKVCLDATLF